MGAPAYMAKWGVGEVSGAPGFPIGISLGLPDSRLGLIKSAWQGFVPSWWTVYVGSFG